MAKKIRNLLFLTLLIGINGLYVVNSNGLAEMTSRNISLLLSQDSSQTISVLSPSEGNMQWSYHYGNVTDDWGYALIQTADGGFMLAGTRFNNDTDDYDAWLVKTDGNGELQWDSVFGTYEDDWVYTVIQTADGGYALAGGTYSGSAGLGGWDAWLVKIDSNGEYQWDQIYGNSEDDEVYAVIQTPDDGFALAGSTIDPETGDYDAWLVKTDSNGDYQWDQIYGGYGDDWSWSVMKTGENGYIFGGTTFNNDTGDYDAWLMKTDNNGEWQWDQIYGTNKDDWAYSTIQTLDGGYALAGSTFDNETDDYDFWLLKTDANGTYLWDWSYGTYEDDEAYAILQTTDGGFALVGYTDSSGEGIWDAWLVKTDANGELQWDQVYGDEEDNWAEALLQTADKGFIFIGTAFISETNAYDFWLVKAVAPLETTTAPPETITPPKTTNPPPETTIIATETATVTSTAETTPGGFVPGMTAFTGLVALFALGIWRKRR